MKIKNHKDFWAGIMFIVFGAFFACIGTQYKIGIAAKMAPGYFPTLLGIIVIVLGIIISLGSMSSKTNAEALDKFNVPAMLLITGAVVLFGVLLRPLGLVVGMLILIVISSYASHEFSLKATLINALVLMIICITIFIWMLKLPLQLWPFFIGR